MGRPKKNYDYIQKIELKHNEIPAKINLETGEVTGITNKKNPNVQLIKFAFGGLFKKDFNNSWKFLLRELTPLEISAVNYLCSLAQMNTGSLEPLNDDTTLKELTIHLNVSINRVRVVLNKLFLYGVYGRFEVYNPDKPYSKYWIINPFLSFAGDLIDQEIVNLFKNTYIAKAYFDPNFVFKITNRNKHLITSV